MATTRAHIVVSGRVQGVFYRYSAVEEATRLGLSGWVKNLRDGRVEAVAEGERDAVERFVEWCRRGPPSAHVEKLDVDWEAPTGEFRGFETRY
ncbi:MAG: acylphosphatase [Planctomycetes bacterium]|nr:acylphosphatase [Planctomycetota bacterium]